MEHRTINAIAPVRINDIGGWTDTRFAKYGSVCNIAVSPGVELQARIKPGERSVKLAMIDRYHNIRGSDASLFEAIADRLLPGEYDIDITTYSQIPPGSSCGTSAAVLVAFVATLCEYEGQILPREMVAEIAHEAELSMGLEAGTQDHMASAIGGVTYYGGAYPCPAYRPIDLQKIERELERRLVLVFYGGPHDSSEIHKTVIQELGDDASTDSRIGILRSFAQSTAQALELADYKTYGEIMSDNTVVQRQILYSLVSIHADTITAIACKYDVLGWKVNGAGGMGGSMTLLTDGDMQKRSELMRALEAYNPINVKIAPGVVAWEQGE